MRVIERELKSKITDRRCLSKSQASINSDGMLTLRNYGDTADADEIIIFNQNESLAILRLFKELYKIFERGELPF